MVANAWMDAHCVPRVPVTVYWSWQTHTACSSWTHTCVFTVLLAVQRAQLHVLMPAVGSEPPTLAGLPSQFKFAAMPPMEIWLRILTFIGRHQFAGHQVSRKAPKKRTDQLLVHLPATYLPPTCKTQTQQLSSYGVPLLIVLGNRPTLCRQKPAVV